MDCGKCGADLGGHESSHQISIEVMGDEHTYAYWLCDPCGSYTRVIFVDRFLGPETTLGPTLVGWKDGERCVALIRACPDRRDKKCTCRSHREFPV